MEKLSHYTIFITIHVYYLSSEKLQQVVLNRTSTSLFHAMLKPILSFVSAYVILSMYTFIFYEVLLLHVDNMKL